MTASSDRTAMVWDAAAGGAALQASVGDDGAVLFTTPFLLGVHGPSRPVRCPHGRPRVPDAPSSRTSFTFQVLNGHTKSLYCVAWSHDGKTLLTGCASLVPLRPPLLRLEKECRPRLRWLEPSSTSFSSGPVVCVSQIGRPDCEAVEHGRRRPEGVAKGLGLILFLLSTVSPPICPLTRLPFPNLLDPGRDSA